MLLKYFYDDNLAQASYLLGYPDQGIALVIDPARDIQPYLHAAEQNSLRITGVVETHIHADFVSGARELVHQTGAHLYQSGMGEDDLDYAYPPDETQNITFLRDGDHIMLGDIRLDVLHTPGHTPEHIALLVTDSGADQPIGIFTGDCLFAGDIGRPDLLEEAVKRANTKETSARQQFANIQRFKSMPDYRQVWPGHGAGSACGKTLGAIPSTTLGYEKLFNPAFQQPDETAFVRWLLEDQPETPHYFAQMKEVNRVGPALLNTLKDPERLSEEALLALLKADNALIIDARPALNDDGCYTGSTLSIPGTAKRFNTYAGWYVNYDQPTYLIADETEIPRLLHMLRAVGVDNIPAYFTPDAAHEHETCIERIDPHTAAEQYTSGEAIILDVRGKSERKESRVPGSMFIPMGYIPARLDEIPRDKPVITLCSSGTRSFIVASILQKHGYDVVNLKGGIDAWKEAHLPVKNG